MEEQIYRGQIYNVDFGETSGSEQGGIRPALIIQNNTGNRHSPTTIVCPITSQVKTTLPTHVNIDFLYKPSIILCEQIRTIDISKVYKDTLLGNLRKDEMEKVETALRISLGLK